MILGAGVSQALAVPGTATITAAVDAALVRYGPPYTNLRNRLHGRFKAHYSFETLAAALEACEPFGQPGFIPGAVYEAVGPEIAALRPGLTVDLARSMYEKLISVLTQQVSTDQTSPAGKPTRDALKRTFDELARQHRLEIVTLNYDLTDEQFIPEALDGFVGDGEYQTFDSRAFLLDDGRPRIAHLHGSLRFGTTETGSNFVKNTGTLTPRRVPLWRYRADGSFYTGLITGEDKAGKLVLPPYSIYYAWLAARLFASPRIVVAGYGIGDVHLNVWLANAARHHTGADFRIVIVDLFDEGKAPDGTMQMFAFGAGFENGVNAEPALQNLKFEDGIAEHAGAMLVRTGMPLTTSQLARVTAFLAPQIMSGA